MTTKNLGLVKAIHSGLTPPTNIEMIWYDTNAKLHKYYNTDTNTWSLLKEPGDHNDFSGKQGGNGVDEFYHLTEAQFNSLISGIGTVEKLAFWTNTNELGDSNISYDNVSGNIAINSAVVGNTKMYFENTDALYGFSAISTAAITGGAFVYAIQGISDSDNSASIGIFGQSTKATSSHSTGVAGFAGDAGSFPSIATDGSLFGVQGHVTVDSSEYGAALAGKVTGLGEGVALWLDTSSAVGTTHIMRLSDGNDNTGKFLKILDSDGNVGFDEVSGVVNGNGVANQFAYWIDSDTLASSSIYQYLSSENRLLFSEGSNLGLSNSFISIVPDGISSEAWTYMMQLGSDNHTIPNGLLINMSTDTATRAANSIAAHFLASGGSSLGYFNYSIYSKANTNSFGTNVAGYFEAVNAGSGDGYVLQLLNGNDNSNKYLRINGTDGFVTFDGVLLDNGSEVNIGTTISTESRLNVSADSHKYASSTTNTSNLPEVVGGAFSVLGSNVSQTAILAGVGTAPTLLEKNVGGYFYSNSGNEAVALVAVANDSNSNDNIGLLLQVANAGSGNAYFMRVTDGLTDNTGKIFQIVDANGNVELVDAASGNLVAGEQTSYYLPRWSSVLNELESSIIRSNDTNTVLSIFDTPDTTKQFYIKSANDANITLDIYTPAVGLDDLRGVNVVVDGESLKNAGYGVLSKVDLTTTDAFGIYGIAGNLSPVTGIGYVGGYFDSGKSGVLNYGIYAKTTQSNTQTNVAGYFEATNGSGNSYALQVKDGNQDINKVLTCIDSDGHAEWRTIGVGGDVIAGTQTTNFLTKWTTANVIANSLIQDDGSTIAVGDASLSSDYFLNISQAYSNWAVRVQNTKSANYPVAYYGIVDNGSNGNIGSVMSIGSLGNYQQPSGSSVGYISNVDETSRTAIGYYASINNDNLADNIGLYLTLANAGGGNVYPFRIDLGVDNTDKILKVIDSSGNMSFTTISNEILNDSSISLTETWSSSKIDEALTEIYSMYNRRKAVIDFVNVTQAPPSEDLGDRYILDNSGTPHVDWDGANQNDIVEYNGTTWIAVTPHEGWVAYVDDQNKDALFVDDGLPQWELRNNAIVNHNDLQSIQGGTTSQHYHLTQAQHTGLTGGTTSQIAYYTSNGIIGGNDDFTYNSTTKALNVIGNIRSSAEVHAGTKVVIASKVEQVYDSVNQSLKFNFL